MSEINPKIFKGYDIRGIYPTELNEEVIYKITKAIFTFFIKKLGKQKSPKVVLSYDGRLSSPSLLNEARKALIEQGADVIDIGLSGTPTFYFAVHTYGYDAGLQVSASHNPREYNGIKFTLNTPEGLLKVGKKTGLLEVKENSFAENFVSLDGHGSAVEKEGVLDDQIKNAFEMAKNPKIDRFKVVADAANAVGALYLEALFKKLPCELIRLNFEVDGNFPAHQPDPLQFDTLDDLRNRVVEEKADLGIAPDGDGDRVFFIDEKGMVIPASLITSLLAKEILKEHPGEKIVFDVRNSMNIEHTVKEAGGKPVITNVGHAIITETMKREKASFAGENSGHYFFEENGYGENPIPVILTILSVMTREEKPISEILRPLSVSFESGEINFKTENADEIMTVAKERYSDGKIFLLDGLSVDFEDWRFNLRSSNTESLMRLNVEGLSKKLMEEKRDELVELIEENE